MLRLTMFESNLEILPQLIVNALITGSLYALLSSGLSLTYGLLRILNFAHGHIMMTGAYLFYLFYVQLELGLPISVLATFCSSLLLAEIILKIFVVPFLKYGYLLVFVTTLALSTILESIVSMVFGVNVKSLFFAGESIQIASVYITPIQIVIIVSTLLILSLLAFLIHQTSLGRKIRALSNHAPAAKSLGISEPMAMHYVFAVGVLLCAYAGVLIGIESNLQPTMGSAYTIKAFAAMVLGGLGNIWGAVIGAYILGLVENLSIGLDFGSYSLPAGYKDAFGFVIILIVLLVKPSGLFGTKVRTA